MKKFDVISIGSAVRDVFILNQDLKYPHQALSPFDPRIIGDKIAVKDVYFDIGGGGSNTAVTFANLGLKTALLSRVGDDLAGQEILRVMKKFKVNLDLMSINKHEETGYSIIFLNQDRDRTALVFRGAADFKRLKKLPLSKLNAHWLFITTLNGNLTSLCQIFKIAQQKKIKIAWNPGNAELARGQQKLKPFLKQAQVVFLNLTETKTLLKSRARKIERLFDQLFKLSPTTIWCVTGGKQGAWVGYRQKILWAPILDKKVVNATGAGDAFGSGFVAGLILYHGDLKKAFQLAMLNSNSVVTKMGAKHGLLKKLPTLKMLDKIKVKAIKF